MRFTHTVCCLAFAISAISYPAWSQNLNASSDTPLRITGHYFYLMGNSTHISTNRFNFVAVNTPAGWGVFATNSTYIDDWGMMWYDGTNIYTLTTNARDPIGRMMPRHPEFNPYGIRGNVYPGEFFAKAEKDTVVLFIPWVSFHLSPKLAMRIWPNGIGDFTLWGDRNALSPYGNKYYMTFSDDGQIIQKICSVRDSKLDCKTDEDELRRPHLNYPFSEVLRDSTLDMLQDRRLEPNGFTNFVYECLEARLTNNLVIPIQTRCVQYDPDLRRAGQVGIIKVCEYFLKVDSIQFVNSMTLPNIAPPSRAFVFDFRYQATNSRTKFNYAKYTLNSGEHFKSNNDTELLTQAKDWLDHGPGYNSRRFKRGFVLAGMIAVALSSGFILFFNKKTKQK